MKRISKPVQRQTSRAIAEILDSDDELPDFYVETADIPAYLNDSRFDHIELPWLAHCMPVTTTKETTTSKRTEEDAAPVIINDNGKTKILLSTGFMSTRDLFLVKSIEEYCSESTLLWFIESLTTKSDKDRIHKSCLPSILFQDYESNEVKPFDSFNAKYYFQLVVLK